MKKPTRPGLFQRRNFFALYLISAFFPFAVSITGVSAEQARWVFAKVEDRSRSETVTMEQWDQYRYPGDKSPLFSSDARRTSDSSAYVHVTVYPGGASECSMKFKMSWTLPQAVEPGSAFSGSLSIEDDGTNCDRALGSLVCRADLSGVVPYGPAQYPEFSVQAGGEAKHPDAWWPSKSAPFSFPLPSLDPNAAAADRFTVTMVFGAREPLPEYPGNGQGEMVFEYRLQGQEGGAVVPGTKKKAVDWRVVAGIGAGAVAAAASAAALARRLKRKQEAKRDKGDGGKKDEPPIYILQLSKDTLTLKSGKPETLQIKAWRVTESGGYSPAPEVSLALSLSPQVAELSVSPQQGQGSLACTVLLSRASKETRADLIVLAQAAGTEKTAQVSLEFSFELELRLRVEGSEYRREGDQYVFPVAYSEQTNEWNFKPLVAYFSRPNEESSVKPPFTPVFGKVHIEPEFLEIPGPPVSSDGGLAWTFPPMRLKPGVELKNDWLLGNGRIHVSVTCTESKT